MYMHFFLKKNKEDRLIIFALKFFEIQILFSIYLN